MSQAAAAPKARSARRWAVPLVAVGLVLLVAHLYIQAAGLLYARPALVRGLDERAAEFSERFTQRLREQFPPGSAKADLERELERQGFRVGGFGPRPAPGLAVWGSSFPGAPCGTTVNVVWGAVEGLLTETRGYSSTACL